MATTVIIYITVRKIKLYRHEIKSRICIRYGRSTCCESVLEESHMRKCKITVLKTTLDEELAKEYGVPGLQACIQTGLQSRSTGIKEGKYI